MADPAETVRRAAAPAPYVLFPGTAREALGRYAQIFGGKLSLFSYAEFSRADGAGEAIAHGMLDGVVTLFGADAAEGEKSVAMQGLMLSLLGTAAPEVLHGWFDQLAQDGVVIDPLAAKPWGATDGQVVDRFGLHWLIGYEPEG
ncbi:VOC family protein [Glutamicibacter sp. 363]|uniref:VOC family protein n=1 Tax=unclassified Glutamicibacter TaxID=2627139 RepID=UPI003FB9DAAE